jgi:hypothetical protein
MIIKTIADIDTQIVNARWRWWHGAWEKNVDLVDAAKAAIDVLLERRYEFMQAADNAAADNAAADNAAAA